ncbi:putative 6-phosphogluconolactonase [Trichoderma ghanense]|uniref:6-phosphogluconolactonase n=1 Tax=Trichoderma ghanense TaxID=65468 RepID=A0ABY2H767_9HYPO
MPSRRNLQKSLVSTLLCAGNLASASLVYVSSYSQTVTTLNYTHGQNTGIQKLNPVAVSQGCSDNPSWLTLDATDSILYCINEGLNTPNGALTAFKTSASGSLQQLGQSSTPNGPVSGVVFGNNRHGLALAHYGGSAFTTWDVSNPNSLKLLQTKTYKLTGPPARPDRQDAPHPHEAVLDPTGKFLLVPDLGMDLIHLYSFDPNTLALKDITPLSVKPGSGPRHLTFVVKGIKTFAYLVTELGNTIIGYDVTYPNGQIKLSEIFNIPSHGAGPAEPSSYAAAEVVVSPDSNYLIVSSRAENSTSIPDFDDPSRVIPSDPLINFRINPTTGQLQLLQVVPAGGQFPRQFSINKEGNLLAVGLQDDGRVVFVDRSPETGLLGGFVAYADIEGQITAAIFDQK